MRVLYALIILFHLILAGLSAQPVGDLGKVKRGAPKGLKEASETYRQFRENGVLLVKIPTGQKKFAAMERQLKMNHSDRLQKYLRREKEKLAKMRDSLLSGFQKYYTFSPVIAVYDTAYELVLKQPNGKHALMDNRLNPIGAQSLSGKKVLTFRLDRYVYDENKSVDAFVITDLDGKIAPYPFPNFIPLKFRRRPITEDNSSDWLGVRNAFRKKQLSGFYKRYTWKKMDRNPSIAVVKFLQLKFDTFGDYINYFSTKS